VLVEGVAEGEFGERGREGLEGMVEISVEDEGYEGGGEAFDWLVERTTKYEVCQFQR
jgi:hypothetical protein